MNADQPASGTCTKCGCALPPDAPRGLCVKCLFAAALETGPEAQLADEPALPRRFGAYELHEEIARGGMGVVWKARQVQLNRMVALKVIRDAEFSTTRLRQRFQIEAEAAAKLDHPNIVPIYEFGTVDERQFISMKLVGEGQFVNADDRQAAVNFAFRKAGVDCVTIGFGSTSEVDEAIKRISTALNA